MTYYVVLAIIVCLNPYSILGLNLADCILGLVGFLYLFKYKKTTVNIKYLSLLALLFFMGAASLVFSSDFPKSLSGLMLYLNCIIYYFLFTSAEFDKKKFIKSVTYVLAISSIFFIAYQGVICRNRIAGNIGYADTYALLMLIGLYFNKIKGVTKYDSYIEAMLLLSIIYTNSRNSLLYALIYIAVVTLKEKNQAATRLRHVFIFFLTLMMYVLLQYLGPAALFALPVLFIVRIYFVGSLKPKTENYISILLIVVSICVFFSLGSNLTSRIANTSLKTGVLQERFVYYEDSIKHIIHNPLGSGVNTFEYKQFQDQSAFYDSSFIHNSFIQTAYDLGLQGLVIFSLLFVYGLYTISKTKENKLYMLFLYCTLYLHSLLDFDFSFSSIMLFVILLAAFSHLDKVKELPGKAIISINAVPAILSCYLIIVNCLYLYGGILSSAKSYDKAINIYSAINKITFKNSEASYEIGQSYLSKYLQDNSNSSLENALNNYKLSYKLNSYKPSTLWNISYLYYKQNNIDNFIYYSDLFLKKEKYYREFYKDYYKDLNELHLKTNNPTYLNKISDLKRSFEQNRKSINPKAAYMKNQLPESFDLLTK